ncbi:RasGEF domain-containing protein [Fennellomyces sp. T-0311]|nr:RasGEF domain-containing protein [Fennellomyces sp. T-0311]
MEAVEAATAFNWDPDVLARQIAAIDAELYSNVVLKKKWLCQLDKKQTKLCHLVDFHRYLTHSFAHQLIFWSELAHNNSSQVVVVPPIHPKDNLVTHLVRVAYLLVHVYRDMNGFAAIMRALMLPEVRRLRKVWQTCPTRTRELYRELAQIMSPSKNHQAYHDLLRRKLELFHAHASTGSTIAVPWIQPHLSAIQSIIKEYAADDDHRARIGEIVLSSPGARKLSVVAALLELCKVNTTSESADLEELSTKNSRRMSFKPIHLDGLRSTVIPPHDLNGLLPGDVVAHHWLVSRVYLTKDQLINESIEVEPLQPGESLARDTEPVAVETPLPPSQPVVMEEPAPAPERKGEPVAKPIEENLHNVWSLEEAKPVEDQKPRLREISVTNQSTQSESTHQESAASKQTKKSRLSPTAPEFVPSRKLSVSAPTADAPSSVVVSPASSVHPGAIAEEEDDDPEDEEWRGYSYYDKKGGDTESETWKGYPSPPMEASNAGKESDRRMSSSPSESSEEWKGYQASKMEAAWQRDIDLQVQQRDWQGYTLETLNEDELDSSTMMDGEFEKSRQARRQDDPLESFRRHAESNTTRWTPKLHS